MEKGPIPLKADLCDSVVSYSTNIAPIITAKCAIPGCHDAGAFDGDYTTYSDLKIRADDGRLKNSVVVLKSMPKAGYTALTELEISEINCWIEQGALNN